MLWCVIAGWIMFFVPSVWVETGHVCMIVAWGVMLWCIVTQCIQTRYKFFSHAQWALCIKHAMAFATFSLLYSYLVLTLSCFMNDYSVWYVWQHSHDALPWWYRLAVPWGAHEGSWLLWWLLAMCYSYRYVCQQYRYLYKSLPALLSLWCIHLGFGTFIIFTSNPFVRLLPIPPVNGQDLNPLLQDPWFLIHPPCLYLGYVGFLIPYIMAIDCLSKPYLWQSRTWLNQLRPWALWSWSWLTLGITLGSWWAYKELGWGGWWFWDPVENASLMPWLCATALLHAVYQKSQSAVFWSILTAILGFILCLVGTFLVRAGLIVSVHSFVHDPYRGGFLFFGVMLVLLSSACCFYNYANAATGANQIRKSSMSRLLLLQSQLLMAMVFVIFMGTIYPLVVEVLRNQKLAIGPDYYEQVLMPFSYVLGILMAIMPCVERRLSWHFSIFLFLLSVVVGFLLNALFVQVFALQGSPSTLLSLIICSAIVVTNTFCYIGCSSNRVAQIAHLSVALGFLVMVVNRHYEMSWMLHLNPGEETTVSGIKFVMGPSTDIQKDNFIRHQVPLRMYDNHKIIDFMPALQYYPSTKTTQTKVSIVSNGWGDWMVALAKPSTHQPYVVRVYYKPLQIWLWIIGFLLSICGLIKSQWSYKNH